jgi:hypothetical protein
LTRLVAAWERFWFAPQSTATLALLRIVFGALVFVWAVSLVPDVGAFFTDAGVVPDALVTYWGLLQLFPGAVGAWALLAVLAAGALALAVGLYTRIAAVVVLIGVISIERRNILVYNAGDELIRILAFYLALAPAGAALSVDRRRREPERFWEFPARAPWALRLMQIQVSVIYLSSVWEKLHGFTWRNGTAVAYALELHDLHRFPLPAFMHTWAPAVALLTWGTLATEFAIGVLVWTRWRLPVLAAGALMHLGFSYAMRLGFFSTAVWTLYLAFLPPELSERIVLATRRLITPKGFHRPLGVCDAFKSAGNG